MANLCHHYWRNVGCRRIVPVWRSFRIEFALKRCLRLPERVLRPGNGERNPVRLRAPTRPQKRPHEVGGMPIVRFAAAGQPRLCVCQFVRQHSTQLGTAQLPLRNPYLMDSTGVVASNIGAEISAFADFLNYASNINALGVTLEFVKNAFSTVFCVVDSTGLQATGYALVF